MRDTVARLCAESSDRIPTWLLPVVRHNLADGGEIARSALVVAGWARYAEGVDEHGEPIEVVDRLRDTLLATPARQHTDPLAFLRQRDLFGDLVDDERFVTATPGRWAPCTTGGRGPPCRNSPRVRPPAESDARRVSCAVPR